MKRVLLRRAIKLNKERKRRKYLQKIVQAMAAVVVFCTTYALILPAITMEQERLCGLQTHVHEDRCYESNPYYNLSCMVTEAEGTLVLHSHGKECYDREGKLRCHLPDRPAHTHEEGCYGEPAVLCGLTEEQAHAHSNACTTEKVLICTLTEGQIHLHDTTCSQAERVLNCTIPEGEGHSHSDACAATQQVLICGQEETAGHAHGDGCYDGEGNLICTAAVQDGHSHSEGCYENQSVPCPIPEAPAHIHEAGCYGTRLTGCSQEENVPHTHGDICYETRSITCPLTEGSGHSHTAQCFGEKTLVCHLEEIQPHHHDENCYDAMGTRNCGKPEILVHTHADGCLTDTGEVVRKLICTQEEHEHEDVCYADGTAPEILEYLCGYGEHVHGEECLDENLQLVCTIPEHTHTAACVMTDLDLNADVETPDVWDAMFRDMPLTGSWPEDLVSVAQSQLNYRESIRNCALEDQRLKGYTRYGACYDQPYADWDSLFIRFCMDYAGIRYYPWQQGAAGWITQLRQQQMFRTADAYIPKAGDLVFFCRNTEALSDETLTLEAKLQLADHAGIVTAWIPEAEGNPAMIRVIEGDVKDRVCNVTYEAQDLKILGYGEMLPGFAEEMHNTGADYSIALSFTPEAKIPRNAQLTVREILPETEEYEACYRQSVESLLGRTNAETEEELGVTFARYFDIKFQVAGSPIEPEAPVNVQIQYAQPISVSTEQAGTAVHFAQEGIELLDVTLSGAAGAVQETTEEVTTEPTEAAETMPLETETAETMEATETVESAQPEALVQVDTFAFTQGSFSVVGTVLSNARVIPADVWLDGSLDGLMSFGGSPNRRQRLEGGYLPTSWDSPTKYAYKLKGWYDVANGRYYQPGEQANVPHNTVFYADWEAATYDIGKPNAHVVNSLDTNEFVTTHVFDYNILFNAQSLNVSGTPNASGHSETWSMVTDGQVKYPYRSNGNSGARSLNFIFSDWDGSGKITRPSNINTQNTSQDTITSGILGKVNGYNLIDLLFNPGTEVIGKSYLGMGNYLFQYADTPGDPYYGYYYYDSWRNAASYNQSENRFYVYDYKEYTSDSVRDGEHESGMGDFLPLNSPYANTNGRNLAMATSSDYKYDAKWNSEGSSTNNVMTNFNFGMSSNIHFYLPHAAGYVDANGNYGNKSTTGDPMIFEFAGDDDVWVLLDGQLLLDIGGVHGVRGGSIDFSSGLVTYADDPDHPVPFTTPEGPHDLTIYYLERGSSKSNCKIKFNLAPRYGLDLNKTDYITGASLPGVVFEVFNDVNCSTPATLWTSHDEAKADSQNNPFQKTTNTFITGENGKTHMWGLVAGKTYYIREKTVPDGYPVVNALVRVTLNNHGTDISEVTVIRNGSGTEGFEVTHHSMNKESHLISLSLTNKRIQDPLTSIRAEKQWGEGTSVEVPVKVYLSADGETVGSDVTLSADNAWGHTWRDLPQKDLSGRNILYQVDERPMPGYTKSLEKTVLDTDRVSWVKVGVLESGSTFLLSLDGANALSREWGSFTNGLSLTAAKENSAAHWTAEAYEDGFRLRNSDGQYLAFSNANRYFYATGGLEDNQTFYYDGANLFVMSSNVRYYPTGVGDNGVNASANADSTALYKQVITQQGTTLFRFTNTAIPEERLKPLTIEKLWAGDYPALPEKVLIHVKKDDVIQATLELTAENEWKGVIEGLDGELLTNGGYTLEEDVPFGFAPVFSQIEEIRVDEWHKLNQTNDLVTGETYAFTTGNWALADENGTFKVTSFNGTPKANQSWLVVQSATSDGTIQVLKNVQTGKYIRELEQKFTMSSTVDKQCAVRLLNRRLQFYPQSDGGGWSLSIDQRSGNFNNPGWGSNSGTEFTLYRHEYYSEYHLTLTNTYATYTLPETGGMGTTSFHAFGGLLVLAAALMYIIQPKRRRQKGGR